MTRSSGRRTFWRGAFVLAVVTALSAPVVWPATAANNKVTTGGKGIETMTGVPFSLDPNQPCAHYSNYQANVTFTNPTVDAEIVSLPATLWNEGPGGTYPYAGPLNNNCPSYPFGKAPMAIPGFRVTIPGNQNCTDVPASYKRIDISITVDYASVSPAPPCSGTLKYDLLYKTTPVAIPPFFDAGDNVAVCVPVIAPATCLIGGPAPV